MQSWRYLDQVSGPGGAPNCKTVQIPCETGPLHALTNGMTQVSFPHEDNPQTQMNHPYRQSSFIPPGKEFNK